MRPTLRATAFSLGLAAILSMVVNAQTPSRYSVKQTGDIVQIQDTRAQLSASIVATMSNTYEVQVKGQDIIRKTFATVDDYKARPGLNGIPLLAPFANRLDEQAFYANGKKYNFDMELGNVRGAIPIHGYLSASKDWQLVEAKADATGAWVTSKLEFYKFPQSMKQFPFAHTITMTYRIQDGMLEVRTRIDNLSVEPMPVSVGFHPYFQLTDSSREDWTISVAAKTHWKLAQNKVPTGETEPIENVIPDPKLGALKDLDLDDVFSDLERDAQGRAVVTVKGKQQQLDVLIGPTFKSVVLYSPNPANARGGGGGRGGQAPAGGAPAAGAAAATPPAAGTGQAAAAPAAGNRGGAPNANAQPNRGFMAIEPMAGITDSMNLAQKGLYKELQTIAPGGSWTASFWLRPSGF